MRTMLVWPNPFHAVDHTGRPACVLSYEPEGNGVDTFDDRRFVGASLKATILQKFAPGDARQTVQRTTFEYADEPTKVPATAYYKHAIARGEIFAADAESAKLCGIDSTFLEAGPLLERAREEAIGEWMRQGHEEHDGVPEVLSKFAFGPMPEAIKARADAAAKAADAEKAAKAMAEKAAADKAEADKAAAAKNKNVQPRGGE